MTTVAFTVLHYGTDWLPYSVASVAPCVDRWVFAYSPTPSHGHGTDLPCPDSEDDLRNAVQSAIGQTPFDWYRGSWPHEGAQRDLIYQVAPESDVILVVDADEVWHAGAVPLVVQAALASGAQYNRLPFVHFWRSLNYVCLDAALPTRVIVPRAPNDQGHEAYLNDVPPVLHFGYAIRNELMFYKWQIHGHKAEMSPERWATWWPRYRDWSVERGPFFDLHPVNKDYWRAVRYEGALPDVLTEHPFHKGESQ